MEIHTKIAQTRQSKKQRVPVLSSTGTGFGIVMSLCYVCVAVNPCQQSVVVYVVYRRYRVTCCVLRVPTMPCTGDAGCFVFLALVYVILFSLTVECG